ncbi:MAG: YitT family protein [Anaerolineae bacterium]
MSKSLINSLAPLHRGVTYLEGVGAYTGQEFRVLMCVITRFELVEARQTIREIDPDAFTVVLEASDVMGRFDSKSPLQWLGR